MQGVLMTIYEGLGVEPHLHSCTYAVHDSVFPQQQCLPHNMCPWGPMTSVPEGHLTPVLVL